MTVIALYVAVAALSVLSLTAVVAVFAHRSRDRWLVQGKTVSAGVGAFREGPTQGAPEVQHRRWLMVPVAVSNIVLAALTTFFFAPAGLLGAAAFLSEGGSVSLFWGVVGVAALDGFPLSVMLVATSIQLARRSRSVVPFAFSTGIWGLLHHGALIAAGVGHLLLRPSGREVDMMATVIALAAAGILPCLATVVAGIVAARDAKTLPTNL